MRRSVHPVMRACLATGLTALLVASAALVARPAHSEPSPRRAAAEQPASPSAGDVNLKQSRVYIHVGKTGFGHDHAVVGMLQSGSLKLDVQQDAGQLVFDMRTFDADGDAARKYIGLPGSTDAGTRKQVNDNMRGAAVLNVAKSPTATFTVKSAAPVAEKSRRGLSQYRLAGDFTLHGVTRPIEIMADAEPKDGWLHVRNGFTILQSQFGIQPFTKAFGAVGVTDKLTIWGDLWVSTEQLSTAGRSGAVSQ